MEYAPQNSHSSSLKVPFSLVLTVTPVLPSLLSPRSHMGWGELYPASPSTQQPPGPHTEKSMKIWHVLVLSQMLSNVQRFVTQELPQPEALYLTIPCGFLLGCTELEQASSIHGIL